VTPDSLFSTYLLPLYPPDVAKDLAAARSTDANPGKNPALLEHLDDAARTFVTMHPSVFGRDLDLDYTDASVHRLGAALTRELRDELAAVPDALFNVIIHGVAYVGACVVRSHAGEWLVRRPLWESRVFLRSHAGEAELWLLSWWLRSLADDAFEGHAGLAERYRAYVEVPTTRAEDLAPIGAERALPPLNKVRYDTLVKYLRAHLPELRDLGADFPSATRFEAYRFQRLDFTFVGGARMLVIYGVGEGGLHVFWLDRGGFLKSALFPADAGSEVSTVLGHTLSFTVTHEDERRTHEMLWWGP
jgi:hypothetical protein